VSNSKFSDHVCNWGHTVPERVYPLYPPFCPCYTGLFKRVLLPVFSIASWIFNTVVTTSVISAHTRSQFCPWQYYVTFLPFFLYSILGHNLQLNTDQAWLNLSSVIWQRYSYLTLHELWPQCHILQLVIRTRSVEREVEIWHKEKRPA
jgi:hypothetical protein